MSLLILDHVQLGMPAGEEGRARAFYGELLGLRELPKPPVLARRGGVWFALGGAGELHLGVDDVLVVAQKKKAHPGFVARDVEAVAKALSGAGYPITWDEELAPRRRFFTCDPFGNRLEILEPA